MGKEIGNPVQLNVVFDVDGNIVSSIVHYRISCEYDITARRELSITLPSNRESDLVDILNDTCMPQINTAEGI